LPGLLQDCLSRCRYSSRPSLSIWFLGRIAHAHYRPDRRGGCAEFEATTIRYFFCMFSVLVRPLELLLQLWVVFHKARSRAKTKTSRNYRVSRLVKLNCVLRSILFCSKAYQLSRWHWDCSISSLLLAILLYCQPSPRQPWSVWHR